MTLCLSPSHRCLTTVMVVLAVPGVAADWPNVSPSGKDVYFANPLPPRQGVSANSQHSRRQPAM